MTALHSPRARREAFAWLGGRIRNVVDELLDGLDEAIDADALAGLVAHQLDEHLDWQTAPEPLRPILEAVDGPVLAVAVRTVIITARALREPAGGAA